MLEKLYIYCTGDLHSDFTYWPQTITYINKEKQKREREGASYWLIDIGDHIDRVNPVSEAFMGKGNVSLLNKANYDIVTIGNNEGITFSHEDLVNLYEKATFDVVCSNLKSKMNETPDWLKPSIQVKSESGVKIGYIGLTAPFKPFYERLHWEVASPFQALEKYMPRLKDEVDIIVVLSHLGYDDDVILAESFPDVDVIIGGHTHHLLRYGETINHTVLTATGKGGSHVGEVILTWDHQEKKLVGKEAYVKDVTHLERDEQTVIKLRQLEEEANDILSEQVTTIPHDLRVHWFQETEIIKALTTTLKKWTNADVSMLNAGMLLEPLQAGPITYGQIHRMCPHPINPCLVEVTGSALLEIVRAAESSQVKNLQLEGFGFRGKLLGKMIFSGIDIEYVSQRTEDMFIKDILHHGASIDKNKTYKLATADTFTFGAILPGVAKASVKNYFLPEFLRDILVHTLKEKYPS